MPPPSLGHRKDQQAAQVLRSGLCCLGSRASITLRPRAPEHEMAAEGRVKGGATGKSAHSRLAAGRAARPLAQAQAQAHSAARVPGLLPSRARTQRVGGKARSAACAFGAASGPKRPGPEYWSGAGWTEPRAGGAGVAWRPSPSPRPSSTAVTAARAGPGRAGAQGAGATLGPPRRAGRLHFPSRALMAERGAPPRGGAKGCLGDRPRPSPELFPWFALRKLGDAAL